MSKIKDFYLTHTADLILWSCFPYTLQKSLQIYSVSNMNVNSKKVACRIIYWLHDSEFFYEMRIELNFMCKSNRTVAKN